MYLYVFSILQQHRLSILLHGIQDEPCSYHFIFDLGSISQPFAQQPATFVSTSGESLLSEHQRMRWEKWVKDSNQWMGFRCFRQNQTPPRVGSGIDTETSQFPGKMILDRKRPTRGERKTKACGNHKNKDVYKSRILQYLSISHKIL